MTFPDRVLRSVIRCAPQDPEADLQSNLHVALREWGELLDTLGVDGTILGFLAGLVSKSGVTPTYDLVHQHFRNSADLGDGTAMAAVTRLELLQAATVPCFTGAEFRYALDTFRTELVGQGLQNTLLQTGTILTTGVDKSTMKLGPTGWQTQVQRLFGPNDALTFLSTELSTLLRQSGTGPAEGSVQKDGADVLKLYEQRRDNPLRTGVLSGLTEIDTYHRGLRPGELALVLGFVGHMKSTFCMAWAYKAAVLQGRNVAVVSCEIPLDDLRLLFYGMHANHLKFSAHPCYMTLSATAVSHGALTPEQEAFFRIVVKDLESCPDYGQLYYREPSTSMTIADIQRWAEGHHRRTPLSLLVIDYLGLLDPGRGIGGSETGSRLNAVVRQSKLLAMGFAGGEGIPVLSPFQANREGWKNAEKEGGKYRLTALSWANEAERSADLVYYVYLNDMLRTAKELAVGNLKTRFVPLIADQFKVYADPVTRTVENLDLSQPHQSPVAGITTNF